MGTTRTELVCGYILDYLKKQEHPVDANQIAEITGLNYQSIARLMRILSSERRVKRLPAKGHKFLYRYVTHDKSIKKNLKTPTHVEGRDYVKKFKSSDLYDILVRWSNEGWDPAVVESTKDVMRVLADMYKYAVYAAKGNRVEDSELEPTRQHLERAKQATENYLEFINSLLAETKLWSGSEFSTYLLEAADRDRVLTHSHAVEAYSHTK